MTQPDPILPGVEPREIAAGLPTPSQVARCCEALYTGANAFAKEPLSELWCDLGRWTRRWLDSGYSFRLEAEKALEATTGFSVPVIRWGLDELFGAWTSESIRQLAQDELGDIDILNRFLPHAGSPVLRRAIAPRLVGAVMAGNVPPPVVQTLMACLMIRSPVFIKVSSAEPWFGTLVVRSIRKELPRLGAHVAVACWPGDAGELFGPLFERADALHVFGHDETIRDVQSSIPPSSRLVSRGHRLSATYLTRESLTRNRLERLADSVALDVAVFDQQGCLSPHVVLAETGGEVTPEDLARCLGTEAFPRVARTLPIGRRSSGTSAAIVQFIGVKALMGRVFQTAAGAVILTDAPSFEPSCLGRVLFVRPVDSLDEARRYLLPVSRRLQAIALEAPEGRRPHLAKALTDFGAGRVCRPGELQKPSAAWAGDGGRVLGDLLRWAYLG